MTNSKRKLNGAPYKPTDEKYKDKTFDVLLDQIKTHPCPGPYMRNLRQVFKEYFVYFLQRLFKNRYLKVFPFNHSDAVVSFAKKRNVAPHFVHCFFDSYNHSYTRLYIPTKHYVFKTLKGDEFRNGLQHILKDAQYTAETHFSVLSICYYKDYATELNDLMEIEEGVKFISKLMKCYFSAKLPKNISASCYQDICAIDKKIEDHYQKKIRQHMYVLQIAKRMELI